MSSVIIKDETDKTLVDIDLTDKSLGKYLKSAASLRTLFSAPKLLASPLTEQNGSRTLALALDADVPVGRNAELSLSAGASAAIGIHAAGTDLFDDGDLQAPETVPNGSTYASLTLEAVLGAALGVEAGSISFGFSSGTSIRYGYYHPFDLVGQDPTVKDAVARLLSAAVFPADVADLAQLPARSFATIAGEGELTFKGGASLSTTTNLLATPSLPLVGTVATITQAASVSVNAAWSLKGGFELRLAGMDGKRVRLSYFRRRGRSLSISAKALAGVSVPVRGKDMLTTLMTAISPNPEADVIALVDAGLDDASIEAIQHAIAASIDRSLTISAQFDLSSRQEQEALFSYEIDLSRLDQASTSAVAEALHGRLGPIDDAAATQGGPIRALVSAATSLKVRKSAWRINLLGILNVASFVELVQTGHVSFDHLTGALTAADQISAKRIRVASAPLESDPEKLREVLFEALMVTTAYQASRAFGSTLSLTAEQSYLEQRSPTREADLAEHYRTLVALGLCSDEERDRRLREAQALDIGRSTFFVHNRFEPNACDALFLDSAGAAWPVDRYEAIGRRAFVALLSSTDPNQDFRRRALETDTVWARMRLLGDELRRALPSSVTQDARKLALVTGDVLTIAWWAKAMSRAAKELSAMRAFIGARTGPQLNADPSFKKRKEQLADGLKGMAAATGARFDLPWDVLAMDDAASRLGTLDAAIVSATLIARYAETDPTDAVPAVRRSRARSAARDAAVGRTADRREWTAAELDIFGRHVINLRKGKLSTGGGFSSTEAQVQRIFREHIPAYAAAERREGRTPRVVFFAHGGLIAEKDGLRGVLARQSFWTHNRIYAVSFVWETGLFETIGDIIGLPTRARDRSAVSDAAIELAARPGGKAAWGQMKKSAETAAAPDGGARLVADLAAELSASLGGDIEFHAVGHSAGAIFHAHFLPQLVQPRASGALSVRTLHLLAPAITNDLFKDRLKPLVGAGKPITALATYTMTDDFEQQDHTVRPYGKSLLYLVSGSFEDAVPTRLLGMQKGLRQDAPLLRFFGLAGTEKVADIFFSKTDLASPKNARSESVTHGGFDNDIATMTSVVRRVLDVSDTTAVVDYFEDAVPGFEHAAVGIPPEFDSPARPTSRTRRPERARKQARQPAGRTTRKMARNR